MASPIPRPGSKGWRARQRAKSELRDLLARRIRRRASLLPDLEVRRELYMIADHIEAGSIDAEDWIGDERRAG
jgi:hypothetical protein